MRTISVNLFGPLDQEMLFKNSSIGMTAILFRGE